MIRSQEKNQNLMFWRLSGTLVRKKSPNKKKKKIGHFLTSDGQAKTNVHDVTRKRGIVMTLLKKDLVI